MTIMRAAARLTSIGLVGVAIGVLPALPTLAEAQKPAAAACNPARLVAKAKKAGKQVTMKKARRLCALMDGGVKSQAPTPATKPGSVPVTDLLNGLIKQR
ncbi:hypothetical protein [Nonomuraea endophytica]|uniref:Uncharacterized protein n=1 Tax=Nonomuraea endophytica TaxID=714136 RepID=A0A7W7ZZ89_9ACTN|nr:hypothetical protein [Nonomuraea endophytica]MBB5076469.1 hypothetical protein [Nonomuraea endophytica]